MNIFMLLMLLIFIPVFVFVTLDRSELARYWLSESWDWLSDGESGSTTIRNLGLVLGWLDRPPTGDMAQHSGPASGRNG